MKKLNNALKLLIEEGKKKGKLTYDEINKVLPSEMTFPEELDKLLVLLSDLGIELVEAEAPQAEEAVREEADTEKDDSAAEEPEVKLGAAEKEKTDDPVR